MLYTPPTGSRAESVRRLFDEDRAAPNVELVRCDDEESRAWVLRTRCDVAVEWVANDPEFACRVIPKDRSLDPETLGLWMSMHAAFRGGQAQTGQAGQVAAAVTALASEVVRGDGVEAVLKRAVEQAREGDVVVVSEKVLALALGRTLPRPLFRGIDPKHLPPGARRELARRLTAEAGFPISELDLILADFVDEQTVTVGSGRHNALCASMAAFIQKAAGVAVDVVVADSDTGVDVGVPILGFPTVGATPLGATAGLSIYESLRASAAAEFARGHTLGIPVVIIHPSERNRRRTDMGRPRPYAGLLQAQCEPELHRGLATCAQWSFV